MIVVIYYRRKGDYYEYKMDAEDYSERFSFVPSYGEDMLSLLNVKPGGQLMFEFGGRGCAESVHSTLESIFRQRGYDYRRVFYFPTVGEYAPVVENAGLSVRYAVLFDRPTQLSGSLGDWIRMFVKEPFCGIGEKEKEEIIAQTEKQLEDKLFRNGKWYVDYVRIRMSAYKTVN